MKKKKLIRIVAALVIAGSLAGGGTAIYMFKAPHRDVTTARVDYSLTNSQLVSEYLLDRHAADQKYLAADGDSKILEITGTVQKISEDFNTHKVVLLKEANDKAGVSATFTTAANHKLEGLAIGETITIKGVIRSGASYDDDLGFYENVIIDKSDISNQF